MHQIFISHCQSARPSSHNLWIKGAFLPVLGAMRANSPSEMPTHVAEIKRKVHFVMYEMERLALTGRLDAWTT